MNLKPQPKYLKAGLGKRVVVELATSEGVEQMEFEIVPDEYANFEGGYLGAGTPLARAIEGLDAGQAAPYRRGDAKQVRVLSVEMAQTRDLKDIAERRQENLRRAHDQVDRTNAMVFASSFSGKWGNYDPTGFVENPEEEQNKDEGLES